MVYDSTENIDCQVQDLEVLEDISGTGKKREWSYYKMMNERLSTVYQAVNEKKSYRLIDCCSSLSYAYDSAKNVRKLSHAHFCKVRLCPLCSWRRSLRLYADTMKCVDYLADRNYRYLFITLTVKNCKADELSSTIDNLFKAVKKFDRRKETQCFEGFVRNLEITHNVDYDSPSFDTYHPHFHMLVAVKSTYFARNYISKRHLRALWADCLGITDNDYRQSLQVSIEKCYGNSSKKVAEVSKYASKASEYVIVDDFDLSVSAVRCLDEALHHRRLVTYSKCFREAKQALHLADIEQADLLHIDDDDTSELEADAQEIFWWFSGFRNYIKVAERKKLGDDKYIYNYDRMKELEGLR